MQYALLCRPYAIITPTQNTLKTRECRVVRIIETDVENKFELDILDAPPINVNQEDDN